MSGLHGVCSQAPVVSVSDRSEGGGEWAIELTISPRGRVDGEVVIGLKQRDNVLDAHGKHDTFVIDDNACVRGEVNSGCAGGGGGSRA